MHFHFNFSAIEILWTLQFAAMLVLLVVLQGRDRVRRFPWFTASMVIVALDMLVSHILYRRMPMVVSETIFLAMADLTAIVSLLIVVEIARRAFKDAERALWLSGTAALLMVGAAVLVLWGPWPSYKTLFAASGMVALRLMQLFAQKANLLGDVLTVQLGLLVVIVGRYFHSGWRTHVQRVVIGLATVSLSQLVVSGVQQYIASHATIHSSAEYQHVMDVMTYWRNGNQVVFIVALVWWIACLWIDEPGTEGREPATGNRE